jgi:hypothetical protein
MTRVGRAVGVDVLTAVCVGSGVSVGAGVSVSVINGAAVLVG